MDAPVRESVEDLEGKIKRVRLKITEEIIKLENEAKKHTGYKVGILHGFCTTLICLDKGLE